MRRPDAASRPSLDVPLEPRPGPDDVVPAGRAGGIQCRNPVEHGHCLGWRAVPERRERRRRKNVDAKEEKGAKEKSVGMQERAKD